MRTISCIQPSPRAALPHLAAHLVCFVTPCPRRVRWQASCWLSPPSRHAHAHPKLLVEPHYSHRTSCWIPQHKRLIFTSPTHWSMSFRSRISTLYGTVGDFRTQTRIAAVSPKLSPGVASTNRCHPGQSPSESLHRPQLADAPLELVCC